MSIKLRISIFLGFLSLLVMGSLLYYCMTTHPTQKNIEVLEQQKTIKIGYLKIMAALPYIYAVERDLFSKHGLNVESVEFGSSNDVVAAALTKKIDVIGAGATNAALDGMTASGQMLQLFTTNNYIERENNQSTDFLLSLPEFSTMESLRGQPIAFFPGSFGRMFAKQILPQYGLTIEDIKYVEMGPGQWLSAIKSGSVKAVTALEPFATKIMTSLDVNVLINGYYAKVMQGIPASGSWFIKDHLPRSTEEKIFEVLTESIRLIQENRADTNLVIESVFGLSDEITQSVRMMDWGDSLQPENRKRIIQYGSILEKSNGVARPVPDENLWVWK